MKVEELIVELQNLVAELKKTELNKQKLIDAMQNVNEIAEEIGDSIE